MHCVSKFLKTYKQYVFAETGISSNPSGKSSGYTVSLTQELKFIENSTTMTYRPILVFECQVVSKSYLNPYNGGYSGDNNYLFVVHW